MRIDQILPSISYGDAVSNSAIIIKKMLESKGISSNIYAGHIHPKLRKIVKPVTKLNNRADGLLFHMATGSRESYIVKEIDIGKKIMIYHNITPARFFKGYSSNAERSVIQGRSELRMLKNDIGLAIGVSEYNRKELEEIGYYNTTVVPFIVNLDDFAQPPAKNIVKQMQDGKTNILFVGRISPNKKQEDIIKAFYCYHKFFNNNSRLTLVGNYTGMEPYYYQLKKLISELNLENDVLITGHIPFSHILAYYHTAHLFFSMSEHEGFCVPLLEAMYFKLPILAYDSSAIGETLGNGGVLFKEKDFVKIAAMIDTLIKNEEFNKSYRMKSSSRLEYFKQEKLESILYSKIIQYMNE
ncbi:glycosyltransferase [Paenibacillus ginsengihumi]|uniref:glycosyltransferase n=1 Tax=Paenibacillus ginsengihumi TaxID=431596 RepID=UPI00037D7AD9|nr:glycosyltransferase [Paenibacillus ginsengihumi]